MGLDPNSTTLHTSTASAPTVILNDRKRPRTDSFDSSVGPGKRPFTASSSLLASQAPVGTTEAALPNATLTTNHLGEQDDNDDDEILKAAREVSTLR